MTVAAIGPIDYSDVTEIAGNRVTPEALSMLYTRYAFGATFCAGRDVLEVACGEAAGLGYIARRARRTVGGDYTPGLLAAANRHYRGRIPFVRLDAHALPFRSGSFGVVLLYEALYYLADASRFVEEARRVLDASGCLVVSTVNPGWADFNPSPFSTRYLSGEELLALLRDRGFRARLYGAFPVSHHSTRLKAVSAIRRAAVKLHLIPRTMKGKALLKRLFLGPLALFPAEVGDDAVPYCTPALLRPTAPMGEFKVLFAVAECLR